ncbi:centrosomal AT-AC splicing factor [Lepisosteus oculatus]|uniref:centrosomal AT-AC splicing factor n=1 Tax=Lepisosteus oculatus TaxID=7918 RepID=UPI0037122903
MGAFYCSVCKQTSFAGKGHMYAKTHQNKLKAVLSKFLDKVKEARRCLKSPRVEKFDPTEHERHVWCYCCGQEVRRHVTNGNLTVLHGGLLEHLASQEHRKSTNRFWWENKADLKLKEKFLVTEDETDRFKAEVAKALEAFEEKEDEYIKQQAAHIQAVEKQRQEILQSLLEPETEREIPNGLTQPDSWNDEASAGSSSHCGTWRPAELTSPQETGPVEDTVWAGTALSLTFIGHQDASNGGNIHTGATPPWLQDDPQEEGSRGAGREIGPSHEEFLKRKEQEKLRKLPSHRVGANFDHSSQTDAGWLPSFGRVWNSGRRWQSRHQFRAEEGELAQRKRARGDQRKGRKKPRLQGPQ